MSVIVASSAAAPVRVMAETENLTEDTGYVSEWENETEAEDTGKTVTLRVCNWEEYIDTGDWDDDELIDLEDGTEILGVNPMTEDFEEWYYKNYGVKVKVEYSTFGTNEDLHNMLTLGDVYDLVCPSEYMIMKFIEEGRLYPLSEEFFDESDPHNYYIKGVSPYIRNIFETKEIGGQAWARYAAGYMWGITGIVYNPAEVTEEEASTWTIINNKKFSRQITLKDNVRDTYFAAVGAIASDKLTSEEFLNDPDYSRRLEAVMNDTSPEMVASVQDYLQKAKDNIYSFETDSGKADMITGKVLANYQWSGDAVYTLDQADEDDYLLDFAVPRESTNIYFDGWVMLKSGVEGDPEKQKAAEAFINFCSRPDNVIRNMYFIGYTSVISGGEDPKIFEYLDWNYGAEEDEENPVDYDVNYFFTEDGEGDYTLSVPEEQTRRQLAAQYPDTETIKRSSIMIYFDDDQSKRINQMWINIRCFNLNNVPGWCWFLAGAVLILGAFWWVVKRRNAGR